jgi:two-component system, response regulator
MRLFRVPTRCDSVVILFILRPPILVSEFVTSLYLFALNPSSKTQQDDLFILVAEDDTDDCEILHEVIGETGRTIDCQFVHDGEALLRHLQVLVASQSARLPDLIVMDVNMPRLDGKEALRRLKQIERLKDIPVVTLTTSRDAKLKEEMEQLGSCAFYTKPHNLDDFKKLVSEMLVECLEPNFGKSTS